MSKSLIFLVNSFLGNFYIHWAIHFAVSGHTVHKPISIHRLSFHIGNKGTAAVDLSMPNDFAVSGLNPTEFNISFGSI